MSKISDWKLAEKLQASGRRGMIIGMCVAVLIIVAVILTIVKINWLKKTFGGCRCEHDLDDEYYIDEDDIADRHYPTSDRDFV